MRFLVSLLSRPSLFASINFFCPPSSREDHYLHKDKDSTQLERSSKIDFAYWRSIVKALVEPSSPSNDIAIANFLAPGECSSSVTRLSD